ncbi:MAG: LysR family transcriptional regulator [Paracoccaceae bacterium]
MNYRHLRYFHAVAHDGNLTRTAGRLNLSQSALSAQIRTLEGRLGHSLFDRTGRSLVLTEAGRVALDYADRIFRTGDELLGMLRQTGQGQLALRVGGLSTLSRNFQLGFLRPVLGRQDVEIVLRSGSQSELLRELAALALDIVLTDVPPLRDVGRPFVLHRIAEQPVCLIGTPGRVGRDALPDDLIRTEPLILPSLETGLRASFDTYTDAQGLRPRLAAEVDDIAMMRLLAREDAGVALLPPIAAQDELDAGVLRRSVHLPGMSEVFFAVTVRRQFPNPLVHELLRRGLG